ncbi:hypothetical protein TNCV_1531351 [Trichonephila clavipes]|nr:hypothetical protein TNCV_1531351 [Trichonephila clavipes]
MVAGGIVSDRGLPCHEFEHSTTKDPPSEIYILSSRHPLQKIRFAKGRMLKMVSDRGLPGHEFDPSTTKDPPCRAAMHVKSVEQLKRPPVGVVWELGEGCQLRCRPRHLTMVQKLRGPSPKALSVAEQCDVNIKSIKSINQREQ